MRWALAIILPLVCVYADDSQYVNVKSVKGGHQGYRNYNPGAKLPNFYNSTQGSSFLNGSQHNTTQKHRNYEIGVCYIEVPTASLVYNQAHIPIGNGSRPELSRIRSCCKGYIRNIHNYWICDPVCSQECVNAVCSAPETCTCFPDHIKNIAGFCIPTCPFGCQNGKCAGGECLCKEGYTLDSESKYCLPICRENCGGIGNCTAPNVCDCRKGYISTPTGNCNPVCDKCLNGDCVAPNDCRCKLGYQKNEQAVCVPHCQNCAPNGKCISPDTCEYPETTTPVISPNFRPSPNIPLYPGNQIYSGNNGKPGYHSGQQGTVEQSGYPAQTNPPGYPTQSGYPSQHGYPGQNESYSQTGQPGYPGYSGQPNRPSQSRPSNQPEQPRHPGYPGQSIQPGQSGPSNQPGLPGYPGQFESYGQTGQSGQTGNYGQTGLHNLPGQPGQPGYSSQPGQTSQHGLTGYAGVQSHSYPPSSGLSGNTHTDTQGQFDVQQYNQDYEIDCVHFCINGFCIEGNKCQCNKGYILDKNDPTQSRCIPYCPGGCTNGVCSAPNFCICNMGFYKDHSVKGRPQCVKRNKRSIEEKENLLLDN